MATIPYRGILNDCSTYWQQVGGAVRSEWTKKITIFAPSSVQKPVLHLVDFLVEGNRPIKYEFKIREISLLQWLWWKCGLWLLSYKYEKKKKLNKSLPKKKRGGIYIVPSHAPLYIHIHNGFFRGLLLSVSPFPPPIACKNINSNIYIPLQPGRALLRGKRGVTIYIYTHIYICTLISCTHRQDIGQTHRQPLYSIHPSLHIGDC